MLCAYLGFLALLFFFQRTLIYPGTQIQVPAKPPTRAGVEVFRVGTGEVSAEAFFAPATGEGPRPVMIYAHGNAGVIDYWVDAIAGFRDRGMGVLLVEYPGYGRSKGRPSERSVREALVAAYDRIAADPRVDPERIIGFGQSLGGGAISQLARVRPLRALILQSTFTSLEIFSDRYFAPRGLLLDRYDTLQVVRHYRRPVLVIHGEGDSLIPWSEGERLAKASADGTFLLLNCGHRCGYPWRGPLWSQVETFLVRAEVLGSSPEAGHDKAG